MKNQSTVKRMKWFGNLIYRTAWRKNLLIILLMSTAWSCTKEVSEPIQLRTPSRPEVMTVSTIVDEYTYAQCCGKIAWKFWFTIPRKAENDMRVWYNWKQKNEQTDHTFYADIKKGNDYGGMATMIDVLGDIEYIRLVKVEGTNRKFNLLHVK